MNKNRSGLPTSEAIITQRLQRNNSELTGQASCLQEVFIPVKISVRKGRRAVVQKPNDQRVNTQFSRLLAKACWLESQLEKCPEATLKEF